VVVDSRIGPPLDAIPTWSADEYLEGKRDALQENAVVLNLCRSYQYLSKGYYVSLLADARGQKVFPTLEMIEEINNPFAYLRALRETGLDTIDFKVLPGRRRLLPKVIVPEAGKAEVLEATGKTGAGMRYEHVHHSYREVTSVFGKTREKPFRKQAAAIFKAYSFPLLRFRLYREEDGWKVGQIFPVPLQQLTPEEIDLFLDQFTKGAFVNAWQENDQPKPQRIACLWDENDAFRASDEETLERFERVALKQGALFEIIGKNDLSRVAEYDALFIRTVTAIDHYSFAFAQTAESLGMPVIDDPESIIKCSNKVYLHELFKREGIPTPRTITVSRRTPMSDIERLGFPMIVKLPQGTFSAAVKKAVNWGELEAILAEMFKDSPLLIVQEFMTSDFDWRIGVLAGKILFACKYHLAKGHWQIARRFASGFTRFGRVEAVALGEVPAEVKELALRSACLIGESLYGVDIKDTASGPVVIEINDNPNIDIGDEDAVEKDRLYEEIIGVFLARIHAHAQIPQAL
jgi:glutathione synthase/RimK-type ligase-like ATP-grasp enzyme